MKKRSLTPIWPPCWSKESLIKEVIGPELIAIIGIIPKPPEEYSEQEVKAYNHGANTAINKVLEYFKEDK